MGAVDIHSPKAVRTFGFYDKKYIEQKEFVVVALSNGQKPLLNIA